MVEFAGWEMPVQYAGIIEEHRAVRDTCGMFDISHMGECFVRGEGAQEWLDTLLTNRVARLASGEAQYSLMLNGRGGVIDDLIVYRIAPDEFLLVVNAAKIEEDGAWMREHLQAGVDLVDASDDYAALAIQGPRASGVFARVFGEPMPEKRNQIVEKAHPAGRIFLVTTGYTGEAGFEAVIPSSAAEEYWDRFAHAGARPCGLGARDTLRLEMCYPLNGSDLSPERTPLEAGLGVFVDLEKEDFSGRQALLRQKAGGLPARLAALRVEEKSPPIRPHYPVFAGNERISETTSGALSPTLGCGIALAYLPPAQARVGESMAIEIRGRRYAARVVKKPFYQPKS